ncbi:hypothetical protein TSMEX_006731 [Taenia solium]|eukprot:TsM_000352900 transcript=TsM_000352900 gene=TsM_000352900
MLCTLGSRASRSMRPDCPIRSGFYDTLAFLPRHQKSLESQPVLCVSIRPKTWIRAPIFH